MALPRIEQVNPERACRARQRQLDYMRGLAREWRDSEARVVADIAAKAQRVRALLERHRPVTAEHRVLEVGSGGTGIVFGWNGRNLVGVDPLADELRELFPWQRTSGVRTVAADGESLPFPDASFDIVMSDNVIDHAENPAAIMAEIGRVLKPGGLFYFTVHVHHPVYHLASQLYGRARRLGLTREIGPFADHTVHLTVGAVEHLFDRLPFRRLHSGVDIGAAWAEARELPPRHLGDRLKRLFFKNATFEAVAMREND